MRNTPFFHLGSQELIDERTQIVIECSHDQRQQGDKTTAQLLIEPESEPEVSQKQGQLDDD